MKHIPVLLKEVIKILNPQPGEFFIDGTIGSGGHATAILEKISSKGKLLGVDWDREAIRRFKIKDLRFKNIILVHGNYADLPEILSAQNGSASGGKKNKLAKADLSIPLRASGLILDLGFSSEHLESGKGFSFAKNEPLDMRYNSEKDLTAGKIINSFSEKDLAEIFWKYGEERLSRKIAKKIIEERKKKPIKTTFNLVEVITNANPRMTRIHPATRVFQALRIYVNDELGNLEKLLKNIDKIIQSKGRVAIISYHSLEDRLVKNCFRDLKNQGKAQILTKKPITPSKEEIINNPRSRSAKLRAIIYDHYSTSQE